MEEWRGVFGRWTGGVMLSVPCPVCGFSALRRFYLMGKSEGHWVRGVVFKARGAGWWWCGNCFAFEHFSALVPLSWRDDLGLKIRAGSLTALPDELERAVQEALGKLAKEAQVNMTCRKVEHHGIGLIAWRPDLDPAAARYAGYRKLSCPSTILGMDDSPWFSVAVQCRQDMGRLTLEGEVWVYCYTKKYWDSLIRPGSVILLRPAGRTHAAELTVTAIGSYQVEMD